MYTFHYELEDKDYFEYSLCHAYTIPKYRKQLMMQRFLIPVMFMILGVLFGTELEYPVISYVVFAIASVGWILLYRKLIEHNLHKNMRIMAQSGKMPYGKDTTLTFGEEKFTSATMDTETLKGYSGIEKIILAQDAVYLYESAVSAYILPYRAFASDEEKEAFLRFIQEKTHAPLVKGVTR